MASEIRVDTSKNTSGLCTVTYSNTGAVFSGITTGTFSGSGANLTGITGTTINTNADNRIITGSGTANTLNGESNLTFDGTKLNIGTGATISSVGNITAGIATFSGIVRLVNTNFSASGDADTLVIGTTSGTRGITIVSGNNNSGNLFFGDDGDNDRGKIQYEHNNDELVFTTNTSERIRIGSSGMITKYDSLNVSLRNAAGTTRGHLQVNGNGIDLQSWMNSTGFISFSTNANTGSAVERMRITSAGDITTSGTTKVRHHSVGIGTTTTTGVNAGVSTAYGEMTYNSTTNNVQVYTTTNLWYNVSDLQGYYKTAAAASSDGMNHYWGGSSSTSIISGLTPSGSPDGAPNTPTVGHTAQSYYGDYPYFDFASGNDQVGYMFLKSGTKWGAGPFTICFWVDVQGVTMESESTYVQLGSHSGTRSMYTVSVDADRKLKAITIGDDTGVNSSAQLIGNTWQHIAVTYNTSLVTKYYMNGSLVRSHTHSDTLDVGTSSQYIYLGYGYWNSSAGNKAAIAHMSDIGIWDAKELNATEILNIYNAKRIIRGY